ncbi:MAG: hypothetical protein OEU44_05740 [Gammaproteobacteria bacterium]|jgi:di/tricarboxylate transporter|nr:hypothetical protein [Gammaproteobacteria bacterium]
MILVYPPDQGKSQKLYIPLSYASKLGVTFTLIGTSTNLVISGMIAHTLASNDADTLFIRDVDMFDLSWIGVTVTVAGLLFLVLFGKWRLAASREASLTGEDVEKRRFRAGFVVYIRACFYYFRMVNAMVILEQRSISLELTFRGYFQEPGLETEP